MSQNTLTNITNKLKDYLSLIEFNELMLKEKENNTIKNRIIIIIMSFIFLFIIMYFYNS